MVYNPVISDPWTKFAEKSILLNIDTSRLQS